ncbi:serine hydrolase domain-containing protein [Thalassomonas haliotis]|uniref:Beta-lactamase family protein n=1 Tax=Thalassomonas haliotis TaxID=485448 RepID=A0ABY7VFC0_9GAMM|nr:serine hydrolase domain-containing protein [Thalassomonas haliotis]WDE12409.1 beta-lactamase family protein [Thalassomonas haliotis]
MKRRILLILSWCFFSIASYAESPESTALTIKEATKALDNYLNDLAKKDKFSGNVLLANNDKVLYQASFGMASKRFNAANNLQTKFNLGSMNKMFTAIGIMKLIEQGKLGLDDKLADYADESWLAKDISKKIEIQHLLSHASGLGSYFNRTFMNSSKNLYRSLDDYKPLLKGESLLFEPGTDNRYSNTGMLMLGVVIEKVSGQSYFDYIREHVYKPAAMLDSGSYEMDQPVANLAIGYEPSDKNETGWTNNLFLHVVKGGPAGGGFSTVGDLHRFALALTNYKFLNKKLTHTLYAPKPELHSPDYSYGFSVRGAKDNRIVGHRGGFLGIGANLDIYLDRGYVSAVVSNYGRSSEPVVRKINELLARVDSH